MSCRTNKCGSKKLFFFQKGDITHEVSSKRVRKCKKNKSNIDDEQFLDCLPSSNSFSAPQGIVKFHCY